MDDVTVRALNAINRAFYRDHSSEFDATRSAPWPGWNVLWDSIESDLDGAPRILDVGCGNGRFGAFCAKRLGSRTAHASYTGVDSSESLLARVRQRGLPFASTELRHADFVLEPEHAFPDSDPRYSLIAMFGVLHHIPGRALRHALLVRLGGLLGRAGRLVVTSWQFEAFARFRDKLIPWEHYNQSAPEPVDLTQLETGDHLLPWGEPVAGHRYCHFSGETEILGHLERAGLEILHSYVADGRDGNLNRYFICRFSAAQVVPNKSVSNP